MGNIQFESKIFGIFAEYSVFSRILGILQNIRFRQNIRHFESAEYSVSADSENLGFGRSLEEKQDSGTALIKSKWHPIYRVLRDLNQQHSGM